MCKNLTMLLSTKRERNRGKISQQMLFCSLSSAKNTKNVSSSSLVEKKDFLKKLGHSRPHFSLFSSFQIKFLNTVDSKQYCRWLDSNFGSLVMEATTLPTAPQPSLPFCFQWKTYQCLCDEVSFESNGDKIKKFHIPR